MAKKKNKQPAKPVQVRVIRSMTSAKNAERNKLLNQYCASLGINKYSPAGGQIYDMMAKMYNAGRRNEVYLAAQSHPLLSEAGYNYDADAAEYKHVKVSAPISTQNPSIREENRKRAAQAHLMALSGLSKATKRTFANTPSTVAPYVGTVTPRKAQAASRSRIKAAPIKLVTPLAAMPTGLQPTTQPKKLAFSPESIRAAMIKHIPAVHHRDFAVYLHRNAASGKSLAKTVKAFLIEKGLADLVRQKPEAPAVEPKTEPENAMNPLPQNAKHTLQLIRMPSEEVIDLGHTSYYAWLTHNHYDDTNHVSQRTAWAYSDGWHIKRCVNTITGEEDFWLISFNGRGGEPINVKSQRDYRSAYRYLAARGYHSTTLEGMENSELYKTYKRELGNDKPEQASKPKAKRKPIRSVPLRTPEQQEERRERANRLRQLRRVAVREGQGRFRLQVLGNYGGACCITGLVDSVEAAHIVPHCDTANQHPANGLPLAKFLHSAFDTGLFSVNPETLRVEVAPAARAWLSIDGIQIADGEIWPIDRVALAAHYAAFKA